MFRAAVATATAKKVLFMVRSVPRAPGGHCQRNGEWRRRSHDLMKCFRHRE